MQEFKSFFDVPTKESFKCNEWNHLLSRNNFWSIQDDLIYRHRAEPRVQRYVPKEETFPIPLRYVDVLNEVHTHKSGCDVRKSALTIIGTSMRLGVCKILRQDSQNSFY